MAGRGRFERARQSSDARGVGSARLTAVGMALSCIHARGAELGRAGAKDAPERFGEVVRIREAAGGRDFLHRKAAVLQKTRSAPHAFVHDELGRRLTLAESELAGGG